MATDLNFELVTYTPEASDAANFTLLDGVADPYPGYKVKVLRTVNGTGDGYINKVLRQVNGTGDGYINKILLEVVDGDNAAPNISNPELTTSNLTTNSFDVTLNQASDDLTPPDQLIYTLYQSQARPLATFNDITQFGQVVASGTQSEFAEGNLVKFNVTGLSPDQIYYYAVSVQDLAGRISLYGDGFELTLSPDVFSLNIIDSAYYGEVGDTVQVNYEIQAGDASVTFSSGNPSIITVDASGLMTFLANGETTVTVVSVQDPNFSDSATVVVDVFTPEAESAQQTFTTE